jgi:(p)ppGpp synthase/HD superfamily hydrolase
MTLLERAIQIAAEFHADQKSKDGLPFILHVLRVMLKMGTDEERIVAVLHDVVGKTELTIEDLRKEGFSAAVLEAVQLLTHEEGISYEDYVRRLKPNDLAAKVKIADLEDNSDLHHLSGDEDKDLEKLQQYLRGWQILKG